MIEKIVAFIVGSCIGSFLNVCIYRLPKDKSIIRPASFCPHCNKPIKWFDNIPIVSYCLLKGKCRSCKGKISLRYFLVELITACIFLFLYIQFSLSGQFFKFAFFFSLLIVVSFIDIDYHAIPAYLCFIGITVGVLFSFHESIAMLKTGYNYTGTLPIVRAFENLIFGLGFTYLFKLFGDIGLSLYLSLRKKESIEGEKEALGLGDVDFMGMVAVFLGSKWLVVSTFFIAPFIAILYSVYALISKRSHLIPYLPYLSMASLVSFLWGRQIISFFGII